MLIWNIHRDYPKMWSFWWLSVRHKLAFSAGHPNPWVWDWGHPCCIFFNGHVRRAVEPYTRKNAQVVAMLFQKLVNRCQQDVFALLVPSLLTSCSNNLLSSCNSTICQQLVSDNLVATWENNSIVTTCWQACHKPVANTSCWRVARFSRVCSVLNQCTLTVLQ